jgi:hypothetical protein
VQELYLKSSYVLLFLYVFIVNPLRAKELNLVLSDPSFKTSSQSLISSQEIKKARAKTLTIFRLVLSIHFKHFRDSN